jgi:FkbM family methyltransferase
MLLKMLRDILNGRQSSAVRQLPAIYKLIELHSQISLMDIGAACITETPIYRTLIDQGLAHLNAFEGDMRHIEKIEETYRSNVTVFPYFLSDGSPKTLYVAAAMSGMTSLLRPSLKALKFFNGFDDFGKIEKEIKVETKRLDDVPNLGAIDFLKMDIQGSELDVLKNGSKILKDCVAIQLETSFIPLYENQPCFGEVDVWMRENGYAPHCFLDVKRWSITPTLKNNNLRIPFNQLLESDIVYIKDPLNLNLLDDNQVKKMIMIAHYCLASYDLSVHAILELQTRGALPDNTHIAYLKSLENK